MTLLTKEVVTQSQSSSRNAPADRTSAARMLLSIWDQLGMLLVLAALLIVVSCTVPHFLSWFNAKGLALSVATVGIVACTMLFCLAGGDFDLSVGSTVAMTGVLAAVTVNHTSSVWLAVCAGILAGGMVGFFNGFVIARLGINALIATLASMQIVRGLAFILCKGMPVGVVDESFFHVGIGRFLGIDHPVWICIGCFIFFGILLKRTTFGRNALAIGGNAEAARLAGINVVRTKIIIFTMQGLAAGLAGVILASRMTSGQPNTAQGLELQVISACVLGGVSLTGGVGAMLGVIIGVFIMGTVQNAMNLGNIDAFYQYVASGCILLAAVLIDRLRARAS